MHRNTLTIMSLVCIVTTVLAAAANAETVPAKEGAKPTAAAPAKPEPTMEEKTLKARTVARLEAYLSGITTIRAKFNQIAPNGDVSSGVFTLKRPGKMRWQYNPPIPILLVSDGGTITYYDSDLGQVNYIDMDDTLASFLARKDILLNSPAIELKEFSAAANAIRVTVVERAKPTEGSLMLEFSDNPLALRFMNVTDASGNTTRVQLQNAEFGVPLADSQFVFKDPRGVTVRKRN